MFGFFKKEKPAEPPIAFSGYMMLIHDDVPRATLERVKLINSKALEYQQRLAEIHRSEVPMFGLLRLQNLHGVYYPDRDAVSVYYYGAKHFAWEGSADEFLAPKTPDFTEQGLLQ